MDELEDRLRHLPLRAPQRDDPQPAERPRLVVDGDDELEAALRALPLRAPGRPALSPQAATRLPWRLGLAAAAALLVAAGAWLLAARSGPQALGPDEPTPLAQPVAAEDPAADPQPAQTLPSTVRTTDPVLTTPHGSYRLIEEYDHAVLEFHDAERDAMLAVTVPVRRIAVVHHPVY